MCVCVSVYVCVCVCVCVCVYFHEMFTLFLFPRGQYIYLSLCNKVFSLSHLKICFEFVLLCFLSFLCSYVVKF